MGEMERGVPEHVDPRLPGGFQLPPFGIHQFLALMIVCVALWAVGTVWLGLQGAQQWIGSWQSSLQLHVYLPLEKRDQITALQERLTALSGVESVRHVSRQEAVEWMRGWLGDTSMDTKKFTKRLPESLELTLASEKNEFLFSDVRDEAARFGAVVNEEEIQLASAHELLQSIRHLAWFATVVLAMAMALIVSNTLRMMILARSDEVHLMRLLGAQEWFVRMPFILEGAIEGFIGGIFSAICLIIAHRFIEGSFPLMQIGTSTYKMLWVTTISFGIGIGLVSSASSVGRFVSKIFAKK